MDFFAIVGGQQQSVYRLNIAQDIQQILARRFEEQAQAFIGAELIAVPFERENFNPDETEVLEISPYDLPELIFNPIANPVGWPSFPRDENLFGRVYSVFGYEPVTDTIVFQVIQRSQRLSTSTLGLILSNDTFTRLESPGLVLGNASHAVYRAGALRFKNLWWLKQILDISSYYRAATDADLGRFAQLDCVKVEALDSLREQAGQWVRTRMAYILDSGVLTHRPVGELCTKASEFGVNLESVNEGGVDKIVIPQDRKALRSVLKFLEEEYYEGPITGAAYEANSKRRI